MEMGILVAFMVVTIAVMVGLIFIFRRWMHRRENIDAAHRPSES